jgi:hypothetical protein
VELLGQSVVAIMMNIYARVPSMRQQSTGETAS